MVRIACTQIAGKWVAKFIGKPTQTIRPSPVMILDVSGSMGNNTFKVVASYKQLLLAAGYPADTKIRFIVFGQHESSFEFPLGRLDTKHSYFDSRNQGATKMAPIVPLVKKVLEQTTEPLWFTIVSDGVLNDGPLFYNRFGQVFGDFAAQSRISVSMVRLTTSSWGFPETKALCAISTLSTAGGNLLETYDATRINSLIELPGSKSQLQAFDAILSATPTGNSTNQIYLADGDVFFMSQMPDCLVVDDVPVEMQEMSAEEAAVMQDALEKKELERLAQARTAGKDIKADVAQLVAMREAIDRRICSLETAVETSTKPSTHQRAQQLLAEAKKNATSVIGRLQELANNDKLAHLNAQQQADYLRNLHSSVKADRDLAKRAARSGTEPQEMFNNSLNKLRNLLQEMKAEQARLDAGEDVPTRCWLSYETSLEAAIAAIEGAIAIVEEVGELDVNNALKLFGLMGVCINHKVGNFTDPAMVYGSILKVFLGCYMLEHSLWNCYKDQPQQDDDAGSVGSWQSYEPEVEAVQHSGDGVIEAPFHKDKRIKHITAVVALKCLNHPLVWKAYQQLTSIAQLTASVQMRRLLTPLPTDRPMFNTGLLLHLVEQQQLGQPIPEAAVSLMRPLTEQMSEYLRSDKWQKAVAEIPQQGLLAMTGQDGFSHYMAPLALCCANTTMAANLLDNTAVLQSVFNFCIWRSFRFKKDQDRLDIIKAFLGIKSQNETHVLPDDQEEPTELQFSSTYEPEEAKMAHFEEKTVHLALFYNWMAQMTGKPQLTLEQFKQKVAGEVEWDVFAVWSVLVAIEARDEKSRIDKDDQKDLFPQPRTTADAQLFIQERVRGFYRQFYERELAEKNARLAAVRERKFIANVGTMTFAEFAEQLPSVIPNATHSAVPLMMIAIEKATTDKAAKVQLTVGGTFEDFCWNNGNVQRPYKHLLEFVSEEVREEIETRMRSWHQLYNRSGSLYNRHGHNNDCPSFWAIAGYDNLELMERKNSDAARELLSAFRRMKNSTDAKDVAVANQIRTSNKIFWRDVKQRLSAVNATL